MVSGIRRRVILYYLAIIAVVVLFMGAFFVWFLNYFYMQTLRDNLFIQARLTASLVEEMLIRDAGPQEIDALSKSLGNELGIRLTLIDIDGTVLADSSENPALMDNHRYRPEVEEALQQGRGAAARYSVTLDEEMYYMAVPLHGSANNSEESGQVAVVRLALPLAGINRAVFNLILFIAGALFAAALVALAAAMILARRITDPIDKISSASLVIAQGNYLPVLEVSGNDELSALALNIKEMGLSLKKKIEQVTWEKSKLETVVSSMSSGIILANCDLSIELINPAAEKLFEISSEAATGKPVQLAVRYYTLIENLKAVYADGQARSLEMNLYYPRSTILETDILPIEDAGKKVIGMLLIFHELTQLRSIEKMRSDFVANASHELRTPLTAVRGYTETILHEELTREQLVVFLEVIDRETRRLSNLLDDLMDLAQIENEKGLVKKEVLDLSLLIHDAVQRIEEQSRHRSVKIALAFHEAAVLVTGNPEWLRQALVNILENSIRHGKEKGEVAIRLFVEGQEAVVEVEDNGPGIPNGDLPYIFERFYRADKARSRKSGGTGLGLSIVKHIMEAHGANYSLKSNEGEGTIFRFALPLLRQ